MSRKETKRSKKITVELPEHERSLLSPVMTLLLLVLLSLGIAIPVIGLMRAKQRKPLLAVNLRGCKPNHIQKALPFGSVTVEVLGKDNQGCALTITDEVEMSETIYRCLYPLKTRELIIRNSAVASNGSSIFWSGAKRYCTRSNQE